MFASKFDLPTNQLPFGKRPSSESWCIQHKSGLKLGDFPSYREAKSTWARLSNRADWSVTKS